MNNEIITKLENAIDMLSEDQKIILWNEYCLSNKNYEDQIFYNNEEEINFMFSNVWDALSAISSYNPNHKYFIYGIYGIETFNYTSDECSPYNSHDIANHIFTSGILPDSIRDNKTFIF